ncbi:hypothetical protein [Methylocystis sp. ATCC 49242]|uniref:hypothetical protein n=1 Tax=Methylocystis sp. ATCC 49242 TaxID=622637 RepID=UPI0001F8783E|nr:hypothetical protein [Methylocystis sp. ATCC 49242]
MRKLILHIGMPKTGTTSLQNFFAENRDFLERDYFSYPDFNVPSEDFPTPLHISTGNGNALVYSIFDKVGRMNCPPSLKYEKIIEDLSNFIESAPSNRCVISHEDLIWIPPTNWLNELVPVLADRKIEVVVIVYIREQSAWLASNFQQHVKQLYAKLPPAQHIARYLHTCEYLRIARTYSKVVGKNNIVVRLLDGRVITHNLVADFMDAFGLDSYPFQDIRIPTANESMSHIATEILWRANNFAISDKNKINMLREISSITSTLNKTPRYVLPNPLIDFVRAYFRKNNEDLAAEFLAPEAGAALLNPVETDGAAINVEDIYDVAASLLVRLQTIKD